MLTGDKLKALCQTPHAHYIKFLWLQVSHDTWGRDEFLTLLFVLLPRCSNLVLVSEAKSRYSIEEDKKSQSKAEPIPYRWSHFGPNIFIDTASLLGLAKTCASTLRYLHLNIGIPSFRSQKDFTKVMGALAQLRELRSITMCSNFGSAGDHTQIDESAERFPADAFPHLERLLVDPNRTVTQFFLYALCSAK